MSLAHFGRRLWKLEEGDRKRDHANSFIQAVFAADREEKRQRRAAFAMMDFARALAGTLDQPPPRAPAGTAAHTSAHTSASGGSPGAPPWGARRADPTPPPGPIYDPAFGGRILAAHGGLGSSADALRALPPPPEPEPPPPTRRERWPWEHWGVPPPPGWTEEEADAGPANETDGEIRQDDDKE